MSPKILIVEDDPDLRLVLASSLSLGAFDSRTATHGREAMDLIRAEPFDAILMDLGLPDMEGTELLRAVRGLTTAPIIVVSGRDTERDKIEALDMGADDYVPKPFLPGELLARIRAALRRQSQSGPGSVAAPDQGPGQRLGRLVLEPRDQSAQVGERRVALTDSEFRVLQTLADSLGAPVDRAALLEALYGPDESRSSKIVEVHLGHVRRKLQGLTGVDLIENRRGRGWILRPFH